MKRKCLRFKKLLTITVDGPAGAGKSTVSRLLAERLSYIYLDTGAIYRVIAYLADKQGIAENEVEKLRSLCEGTAMHFEKKRNQYRIFANGADVSDEIRTPRISMLASKLSALAVVRSGLLSMQRNIAKGGGIVAEGRDMGTVVFPEADLKFFLDAGVDERARRRHAELQRRGCESSLAEVRQEVIVRDNQDRERAFSPLRPAADAVIIDSTNEGVEDVVERMMTYVRRATREC